MSTTSYNPVPQGQPPLPPQYTPSYNPVPQGEFPQGQPPLPPQYTPVQPPKKKRRWPWVVGGAVVLMSLIGACSAAMGGDDTTTTSATEPDTTVSAPAQPKKAEPKKAEAPKPAEPEMTREQREAIEAAESYVDTMPFSRKAWSAVHRQLSSFSGPGRTMILTERRWCVYRHPNLGGNLVSPTCQ